MRPQYEKGIAATAELYIPEEHIAGSATITSGTYTLFLGTSELVAETAATVDPLAQTSVSVSRGDQTVTVTSTSGMKIGRSYWLASSTGRGYLIEAVDLSATVVTMADTARFDITSGVLSGARLTFPLTTTHTATLYRNLREVWEYVIGGETYRQHRIVDIVNSPFDIRINEQDIEEFDPTFGESIGKYSKWRRLVDGALSMMAADLRRNNVLPDKVRDKSVLRNALIFKTLRLRYKEDSWEEMYNSEMSDFYSDTNNWYDDDGDLQVDELELRGTPPAYCKVG